MKVYTGKVLECHRLNAICAKLENYPRHPTLTLAQDPFLDDGGWTTEPRNMLTVYTQFAQDIGFCALTEEALANRNTPGLLAGLVDPPTQAELDTFDEAVLRATDCAVDTDLLP